ncbi:DUF6332 family protein [Streptomyces fractus]|uniref:DUF6332 family protein n=1 Tax=Streptomyces fractus TaxID=641806 RepID=UPI003CF98970
MGAGRESRVEKDAMTVEIVFALVSGTAVAVAVTVLVVAIFPVPLTPHALVAGGAVGFARVVHVLWRFDRERRLGR